MAHVVRSAVPVVACSLVWSIGAHAALVDRGGGLIYDSDRNLIWLANANYGTSSAYDDGFSSSDGFMTWQSAVDWAANLSYYDSVRGTTYDDWRLPATIQPDPTCSTQQGGGQFSTGPNCTGSELGHMFYVELGGTANNPISASSDPDLALFANLLSDGYWSQTQFDATFAWVLNFGYGLQGADQKAIGYYAWAVRDGDVAAVPAPGAAWLLGAGLLALTGRVRRRSHRA